MQSTGKNPYLPGPAPILTICPETEMENTYRIQAEVSADFGQFLEISLPGFGEAPISVSDIGDNWVDLTIRKTGRLTSRIHELQPGDCLYWRGPYGRGFPLERFAGGHLVIVAGGTGLAPVRGIINHFRDRRDSVGRLDILAGFKTPSGVICSGDIQSWEQTFHTIITVDDACEPWSGCEGMVTNFIPDLALENPESTHAVVVGPPVMLRFAVQELLKKGLSGDRIWISLERRMHCGLGKCGHCRIEDKYVCLDGPVFNWTEAKHLKD
mgnify:CR=1 FL=1